MSRLTILALALGGGLLAAVAPARADAPAGSGHFALRTVRAGGGSHRYAVWTPPGWTRAHAWPAILFLHGSGECGDDGVKPTLVGLGPALRAHPERWPFVIVFAQKPSDETEWEENEDLVFAELRDATGALRIDPARVALVGMSQGGHGVWYLGARHPDRWRCLVPVCGYGRARTVAHRAARLPVWAFHGLRDDLVNPADTRAIVAGLRDQKAAMGIDTTTVRMTLYPEANHDTWDPAFAEEELPRWIAACTAPR